MKERENIKNMEKYNFEAYKAYYGRRHGTFLDHHRPRMILGDYKITTTINIYDNKVVIEKIEYRNGVTKIYTPFFKNCPPYIVESRNKIEEFDISEIISIKLKTKYVWTFVEISILVVLFCILLIHPIEFHTIGFCILGTILDFFYASFKTVEIKLKNENSVIFPIKPSKEASSEIDAKLNKLIKKLLETN